MTKVRSVIQHRAISIIPHVSVMQIETRVEWAGSYGMFGSLVLLSSMENSVLEVDKPQCNLSQCLRVYLFYFSFVIEGNKFINSADVAQFSARMRCLP